MSASKQKKTRIAQRESGENAKATAAAEKVKESKKYRAKVIIAIAVIVVLVVAALIITSDSYYTKKNAVQIGETSFSAADVSYFCKTTFNNIYQELYNSLGSMVSYVVDTETPLSEQSYSEDQTWADYVLENSLESMKQTAVYCESAAKAGRTLSEDGKAQVAADVETMRSYASSNNYSNLDSFLVAVYGRGMSEKSYTDLLNRITLASEYANDYLNSLTYTEDELEAYYTENAEKFDYYNFYLYSVGTSLDAFSDLADDAAKLEAAKAAAETIAENDNYEDFLAAVRDLAGEGMTLNLTHNVYGSISDAYRDWVTDPERQVGDTTVIEAESACYAILFVGKDDNHYETVDMRHILMKAEADENGNYSDEALHQAELEIMEVERQWMSNPTEENFASFANSYSEDAGSNTNGGLYEQIAKNSMVAAINDFLFSPDVKSGDTAILYGNNGSYAGYHLVYFVGTNTRYSDLLAESSKKSDDFNSFYEDLSSGYEIVEGKGMKYVSVE